MLQRHDFNPEAEDVPQPTIWSARRRGNRLDCETASLLRQVLSPVFSDAESWEDLRSALRKRDYDVVFDGPRLILIETLGGTKICSCRFLGHPLDALTRRLGKLRVRPAPDANGYGAILD